MKKILIALILCLVSGLAQADVSSFVLEDKTYQLENAPNGAEITISFDTKQNRYAGKAAVNRYFGPYQQENEKITLLPGGATMMMGPPELMQAERDFLNDLSTINAVSLKENKLILTTAKGKELIFIEISPESAP